MQDLARSGLARSGLGVIRTWRDAGLGLMMERLSGRAKSQRARRVRHLHIDAASPQFVDHSPEPIRSEGRKVSAVVSITDEVCNDPAGNAGQRHAEVPVSKGIDQIRRAPAAPDDGK
jgi:hypothetical protein